MSDTFVKVYLWLSTGFGEEPVVPNALQVKPHQGLEYVSVLSDFDRQWL